MRWPWLACFVAMTAGVLVFGRCLAGAAEAESGAVRKGVYHCVERGETLWGISKAYGVSVDTVIKANHLGSARQLKAGRTIFIPGAGAVVKSDPASLKPRSRLIKKSCWRYIIIHHSGTEQGRASAFDRYHRRRGFKNGLGYHFVISNGTMGLADGYVETGPRWRKQMNGAHCNARGMNEMSVGICLVGNFDRKHISQKQFDALVKLVRELKEECGVPTSRVLRHKDAKPGTHCPGKHFPWSKFKKAITSSA